MFNSRYPMSDKKPLFIRLEIISDNQTAVIDKMSNLLYISSKWLLIQVLLLFFFSILFLRIYSNRYMG